MRCTTGFLFQAADKPLTEGRGVEIDPHSAADCELRGPACVLLVTRAGIAAATFDKRSEVSAHDG